jgi:hypothetical protein
MFIHYTLYIQIRKTAKGLIHEKTSSRRQKNQTAGKKQVRLPAKNESGHGIFPQ